MHRRRTSPKPPPTNNPSPQDAYLEDDDYVRFLLSLADGDALPEDDDDDPDFDEDLKKMLEDMSDEEPNDVPPFDAPPDLEFQNWGMPTDPYADAPPTHMPTHPIEESEDLCPAWCTRSRFPLNTMDIEELEQGLYRYTDYTTHDEIPEMQPQPFEYDPHIDVEQPMPQQHRSELLTPCHSLVIVPVNPLTRPGMHKETVMEKPLPEFDDIFPYELCCPRLSDRSLIPESDAQMMHVNTLNGMMAMQMDAWTPETIRVLNRIVNAHVQLLIQSLAVCIGKPHLRQVADSIHSQLHSLYQMFQAQSDFDYGFDTVLKQQVPALPPPRRRTSKKNQRRGKKANGSPRKRRRKNQMSVEEVIDLTLDCHEQQEDSTRSTTLASVLDVPLLRVLPQLWQTLMVACTARHSCLSEQRADPPQDRLKKLGLVASLKVSKDVEMVLELVEWMMSCGITVPSMRTVPLNHKTSWSGTEEGLLGYALREHGEDYALMQMCYFPLKDAKALERKIHIRGYKLGKNWAAIEDLLLDTDRVSSTIAGAKDRMFETQSKLFNLCTDLRDGAQSVSAEGVTMCPVQNLPSHQDLSAFNLVQGFIQSSATQIVDQMFCNRDSRANASAMQNLMCLLLGQIGGQMVGSLDTMLAMMRVLFGMQFINGADNQAGALMQRLLLQQQENNRRDKPQNQDPAGYTPGCT